MFSFSCLSGWTTTVAMKSWKTLKGLFVRPKDKQEKENIIECMYRVPCAKCDKTYVGETGRKFGCTLQEHRIQSWVKSKGVFTRSQRTASLMEYNNKSALTDHSIQENHTIHWKEASVIDKGTRPAHWMDQGSCTYLQGRSPIDELWWGQLSTVSCLWLFSWCDCWSSYQDPEELSTSFFWWRSRDETETSR